MSTSIKQNTDGSTGLAGPGGGQGEFVALAVRYNASSIDETFFTASRRYIVKSVICRPNVAGTDGSAVTAGVNISADGQSIGAGTKCHNSTMDLKGTIHTNQVMSMTNTPSEQILEEGYTLGINYGGTLTSAVGVISVTLCPA